MPASLGKRDQLCEDGGPWPCTEPGCPARFVSCETLTRDRTWCSLSASSFWANDSAAPLSGRIWKNCPRSCDRCAGPSGPSCLELSLGRVEIRHGASSPKLPILVHKAWMRGVASRMARRGLQRRACNDTLFLEARWEGQHWPDTARSTVDSAQATAAVRIGIYGAMEHLSVRLSARSLAPTARGPGLVIYDSRASRELSLWLVLPEQIEGFMAQLNQLHSALVARQIGLRCRELRDRYQGEHFLVTTTSQRPQP